MLHLHNTLTRSLELFKPLDPDLVKIYTCGPTVYSEPHLGNMRPYVFSDVLRTVIHDICGYPVKHVVNMTDVWHLTWDEDDTGEDKLEKGARREGLSTRQVANKYALAFKSYVLELWCGDFVYAMATQHIDGQIQIVKDLESKGYTYIIPGDGIYMDTSLVPEYGKLMWPNYQDHIQWLQSWARVDDTGKKNPTDFALWKFSRGEDRRQMEWIFASGEWEIDRSGTRIIFSWEQGVYVSTPVISRESLTDSELATVGFPGRHIECSVMSRECLWDQIDIHRWWVDHIPVHHTNEIAQSECSFCTTEQFWSQRRRVQIWMHNQFLNINGAKVSKSAWDDLSLKSLKEKWFEASDLRYFFLQAHYRSFQDFNRDYLASARKARLKHRGKLYEIVQQYTWHTIDPLTIASLADQGIIISDQTYVIGCLHDVWTVIFQRLQWQDISHETLSDEIFGIHQPINFQIINAINTLCQDLNTSEFIAMMLSRSYLADLKTEVDLRALEFLYRIDRHILKVGLFDFTSLTETDIIPDHIQDLLDQRIIAKAQKNRTQADVLRDEIGAEWWMVVDTKDGMTVQKQK